MKTRWITVVAVAAGISLAALGASAQGPQGAGAGEAARTGAPHSYNPISWLRKKPLTATESLDTSASQSAKLAAELHRQGVLPSQANLKDSCSSFEDLDQCVATLHAGHNLDLNFDCLKSLVTGVQTGADMSPCAVATNGTPTNLRKAIHALKPDANAKAEAKKAEKQSRQDLQEAES